MSRARISLPIAAVLLVLHGRHVNALSTCPTDSESRICSSHGTCGSDSTCTCFTGWDYSADCSQRTCPSGTAWFDKATDDNVAHADAECSNAGTCDRSTGECACFDGFAGNACQRTSCECSGHGYCKSIADLADAYAGITYTNWEGSVLQLCYCDDGYTGYDCSLRMCPKGDDYKTTGQTYRQIEVDIQPALVTDTLAGTITLHFGKYKVTIDGNQDSVDCDADIIDKLDNINVATCATTPAAGGGATYLIELQAFPSQPKQNNLFYHDGDVTATDFFCNTERLETDGVSPGTCTVTTVNPNDDVYEYAYCGNSGICDFSDGVCTCFDGFTGVACGSLLEVVSSGSSDPVLTLESKSLAYTGDVLELKSTKSGAADFNFVTATDGDSVEAFKLDGTGAMTVAGAITAPSISTTDHTIANTLTVSDGATQFTNTDAATEVVALAATSASFGGDAVSVTVSNTASPSSFYFLHFYDSVATDRFSVRGDGLVTASDANIDFLTVLSELSVDGDMDVAGDGAIRSLTVVEDSSTTTSALSVSSTVGSFTGTVASIGTTLENANTMTILDVTNRDGSVFDIKGDGQATIHTGGLLVDAGGLDVSAGGLTVDAGGASIDGGLTVLDGGTSLTATSGEALTVAGVSSVTGDLASTAPLTVGASSTSFTAASVLKLTHDIAASPEDADFLLGVANGVDTFNIDGQGSLTTLGDVRGTTLGMQPQADGSRPACDATNRGDFYLNTDGTDDELYICMMVSGAMAWQVVTVTPA